MENDTLLKNESYVFHFISNKPFNLIFGVSKLFASINLTAFFILFIFFDAFFLGIIITVSSYILARYISKTNPDIFNIFYDSLKFAGKFRLITKGRKWEP